MQQETQQHEQTLHLYCPVCLKSCLSVSPGEAFYVWGTRYEHTDYWCFRSTSGVLDVTMSAAREKGRVADDALL